MDDRKIFKFLKTLSKRQLNSFEDYVSSPYFNKSEELCFVYVISKKFVLSDTNKNYFDYFKKEFIKAKKVITQKNLDKFLSRIYLLALDFVSQEKLKEKEFLKSSLLMEHLIDRDELSMFEKIYKKAKTTINKQKLSYINLMQKYLLESRKADYLSKNATSRKEKQNLQEVSDALDQFYVTEKYNLEILKLSMREINNYEYKSYFIEEINRSINQEFTSSNFLLNLSQLSYNFIKANTEEKKKIFDTILKKLLERTDELEEYVVYNMGQFLRNQVWRVFQIKDEVYYKYCFKLNKKLLLKGILHYKGNLFASTYKNLVDVAISINELDWCEKFVLKYSKKIAPKKIGMDISNYANARIKFYSGNLEEARSFIQTLQFNDIYYKFAVRRLEIMIYYELKEYLYLESLINSFRVALTPNRINYLKKEIQDINKKFLNYMSKLLKSKQMPRIDKNIFLENLLIEINNDTLLHQSWFMKKIQEVVKSNA